MGPRNPFRLVVAAILLLLGTVWFLQGIGVLPGSFMTGSTFWAFAGAACVVAGILVLFRPGRPATERDPQPRSDGDPPAAP